MFKLKVVGFDEAETLVECRWPTHIVSLMSDATVDWHYAKHLHVQVNDIVFVGKYGIAPSPEHLRTVLEFTKDLTSEDRLLVHCFAGQSRSTAIAIAICIQHGMSYQDAFDHVASVRTILMPNQLFIKHIDAHFDLDNRLIEHAKEHRKNSLQRTLLLPSGPPSAEDVDKIKNLLSDHEQWLNRRKRR